MNLHEWSIQYAAFYHFRSFPVHLSLLKCHMFSWISVHFYSVALSLQSVFASPSLSPFQENRNRNSDTLGSKERWHHHVLDNLKMNGQTPQVYMSAWTHSYIQPISSSQLGVKLSSWKHLITTELVFIKYTLKTKMFCHNFWSISVISNHTVTN